MRLAIRRPVSIVGSAVTVVIPFLVSLYIVYHSKPWLVYFICALRIGTFSSVACAVNASFGSSSWLIGSLFQLPDLCLIPVLLLISHRSLIGYDRARLSLVCIAWSVAVGMINHFVISPFLAEIIDSYETMGRYAIHVGLDWCL